MAIVPTTGAASFGGREPAAPAPSAPPIPAVDQTIGEGADAYFRQRRDQTAQSVETFRAAAKANPDTARKANRLATWSGLPAETVERNMPEVESGIRADAWSQAMRDNPRLSAFLAAPRAAAASSDDLEAMKRISDRFKAFWGPADDAITAGVRGRAAGENAAATSANGWFDRALALGSAGVSGVESGLMTVGAALNEWSANNPLPWTSPENIQRDRDNAAQLRTRSRLLSGVAPVAGATTWEDVKAKPTPGRIGSFVFEQGVQSVPGMITAGVALPAYVASQAGTIGQQRAGYNGRQDANVADVLKAAPAAVASALLERVGIASIFEAGGKTAIRRVLGAAAGEGSTEFAQSVVENAGGTVGTDRGFKLSEALDQGLQGAVAGFGMGGTIRGVHEGVGKLATTYVEAKQAQAGATLLDGIMQDAAASKLREGDPDAYEQFVSAQAEGTPVENVYLPAEAIRALYQSEGKDWNDPDDDLLGGITPDFIEQVEAGLVSGGDVVIPTAAVAAKLAGTPAWEKLKSDARVTPGGMSEAQTRTLETDYADEIAAIEEKATQTAARELEANAPRAKVYDTVLGQMRTQGFSINAARAYAELWADKYQTRAENLGPGHDAFTLMSQSFGGFRSDLRPTLEPFRAGDSLDVLINAMRKGAEPAKPEGQSLLTRIMEGGGIEDTGGDIASMGGKDLARGGHFGRKRKPLIRERDPAQGSFISGGEGNTLTPDAWIDTLVEEGYFPGATERPTVADLMELIGKELAGIPVHPDRGASLASETQNAMATAASDLRQMLDERGLDPETASREEITKAIADAQAGSERSLDQSKRGRIDFLADGRAIIMLFDKRDMSTVLHESGHLWLEELRADAEGMTSPKVFGDWETVKAWFQREGHAIEDGKAIPTEAHEMWARSMERYFMEGKAPTRALDEIFALFSRWLGNIYRIVKDNLVHKRGGLHGSAPLTDDIRGVMNRLIATQDAIDAEQRDAQRFHFADAAEAGMNDQEFTAYQRLVELSRTEAYGALLEQTMERMRREKTKRYQERRVKVRIEAAEAVAAQPLVKAFNIIKGREGQERQPLSREGVTEILGKEAVSLLPAGVPPVVAKKGFHPDTLAELVGIADGRELLNQLIGIETRRKDLLSIGDKRSPIDEMIDTETEARMAERYGDAYDEGRLEEEAKRAIHNSSSADLLAAETRQMAARVGELPAPAKLVKDWAERYVREGKILEQASAGALARHTRAEQMAGREYEKALLAQDMDTAYRAKQRQMFAHALFRAASDAKQRVDVIARRLDRLARAKNMKGLDPEYLDRIHELLENHDLRKRTQKEVRERESFDKWAKRMEEQGVEVTVPERLTLAGNVHFSKMLVGDLIALNDAVVNLDHLGREKLRMTVDGEKRDFEEFMHNTLVASEQLPSRPFKPILNRAGSVSRQVISSFVTVERMADFMDNYDPNGGFNSVLIKGATQAANDFAAINKEVMEPIVSRYVEMPKEQRKRLFERITVPEFSVIDPDTREIRPLTMLRMDLVAVALNTGTESNLDKMIRGENLQWANMPDYAVSEAKIMNALNRELREEDWAFVQGLWEDVGKLWPHIERSERAITGSIPEKVEARKVVTAFGEVQGAYWPAVYDTDPNRSKYANFDANKNAEKDAQTLFGQIGRAVATSNGHTITRTEYAAPMLFSLEGVLFRHVRRVATRAAYGAWARDAMKFMNDGRVEEIVSRKLGREYYQQLHPWLRDQINDSALDTADIRGIDWFLRKARTNATAVGLVYRFTTILTQAFGFANSVAEIGPKHVLDGYVKATANMGAAQREALSLSPELARRAGEFDRDINAALRDLANPPSADTGIVAGVGRALDPAARIKDRWNAFGFELIGMVQLHTVDIPLWIGAYKKGLAQGMTQEQAVNLGDKSVRKAQGSGTAKDLAKIQRLPEGYKLMTTFYTFWGTVLNYQWESAQAVRRGDYKRAMSTVFWVMIAGPLMSGLFLSPPEEDEDWLAWATRNVFFGLWGGVPVVRDWANKWNREAGGQYAADPQTPAGRIVGGVVGSAHDTAKALAQTDAYADAERLLPFLPDPGKPPSDKMLQHYIESFGLLTGTGTGQLATTTQYAADLFAGRQHPEGVRDLAAGIIKGSRKDQR